MKFLKSHGLMAAILLVIMVAVCVWYLKINTIKSPSVFQHLANVTLEVPLVESPVVLTNGSAELPSDDSASGGKVTISGPYSNSGTDQFAIMSVNYGGSGTFEYLVMFAPNSQGVLVQSGLYSLGDRVKVESIVPQGSGSLYSVLVTYLDYAAGESYADAPTERVSANVPVVNHLIDDNNIIPES